MKSGIIVCLMLFTLLPYNVYGAGGYNTMLFTDTTFDVGKNKYINAMALTQKDINNINVYNKPQRVKTGVEVLRERGFEGLKGKRVGLVTNPSGVDYNLKSTIDILFYADSVKLVALYGPEHGVRGDAYAGDKVGDFIDPQTGLPVYSIYGQYREPSQKMLEGIDIMVYDIQDIGTRSYTFISTLGLVMRACAKRGIEVMVLDRPNPLGGNKIEGAVVEQGYFSFVSEFKIPYIYGLTVGELATLINEEGLNCGQKGNERHLKCKLTIVPMEGWGRDMTYDKTGLPWILPSPNIPTPQSAIGYPSAGICGELYNYLNIGIGYTLPFGVFGATWVNANALKEKLDSYNIAGTAFRPIYFKPFAGSSSGKLVQGVQYYFTDYNVATISLTQFYVMQAIGELYADKNPFLNPSDRFAMIDKVCGTNFIRTTFGRTLKVDSIKNYWNKDVEAFRELSKKYYLYKK